MTTGQPPERDASGWAEDAAALPAVSGAYALWIELNEPAPLPPSLGSTLPAGRYVYLGSARGPGGLRARCRRHLASAGRRHWHVDWLTRSAARLAALAFPGSDECELMDRLLGLQGVSVPVPHFGSSDCRHCPAHLIRLDETISAEALATQLGLVATPPW